MSDPTTLDPDARRPRRPLLRTLLGDALRRSRHEQGRTLADVARSARISMPYLSELERGRKEASSEVLAAVCDALRIDLTDVLADVRHHLAEQRAAEQRAAAARVIRIDLARARRAASRTRGSGDVQALAA